MLYNSNILTTGILARYQEQFNAMLSRPHLQDIASIFTEIPSNKASERYAWLGDMPVVREWIGDKALAGLLDYEYAIKNKDWYTGFAVDRNEIEDEQISAIMPRVDMAAMAMANHKADLLIDLLVNGTSNKAFDGQAFFANRTKNNNLIAGAGVSFDNIKADITKARARMMRFSAETAEGRDKPMGLIGDTIVIPPELENTVLEVVRSSGVVVNGQGTVYNPVSNFISKVIVLPELTDVNDWYILCTSFPLKPLIYQPRKAAVPVIDTTEEKRNRKIAFSVESRGNAGYGFYQMAIKVTNT
jgi:phage major head subunit gpT-like protein